jgi:hypothetical protein
MTFRSEAEPTPDEEFEPCPGAPKPQAPDRVADALQSRVIGAFETAIDQGMQPSEALAAILSVISSEMARLKPGRQPSPGR